MQGALQHAVQLQRETSAPVINPKRSSVLDQVIYQHATASDAVPGPGAYDDFTKLAIDGSKGVSSGFKSSVQRSQHFDPRVLGADKVPGPAYYKHRLPQVKKTYNWRRGDFKKNDLYLS